MNRFFLVLETDGWSEERLRPRRCSRIGSRHSRATTPAARLTKIRWWLGVVMLALVVSGVTAFPLQTELAFALRVLHAPWLQPLADRLHLLAWITQVHAALADYQRTLHLSSLRNGLAGVCTSGDCRGLHWPLARPGAQPVGDYVWPDQLCRGAAACVNRRAAARNSAWLAAD